MTICYKMANLDECKHLLSNNENSSEPPPLYTCFAERPSTSINNPQQVEVLPIRPDELPPPYTPPTPQSGLAINCKVCQSIVSIAGKQNQRVVKCDVCNEVTPINVPAPGKMFVRCPCNCLLICNATALKVTCPRATCKRIINLVGLNNVARQAPNTNRVQCIHCGGQFLFAVTTNALVKCPTCYHVSSVERSFVRTRMIVFLALGFVFLAAGIVVTVTTYELASSAGGIYTVWIGAFIVGVSFIIRGIYFATIRTSIIIGPAT